MAQVVILGAGLTGLSTAYHFEKNNFFDFKIFEKEASLGGLARSVKLDGFTFDYTGHLLHSNNHYFDQILEECLPQDERNHIARKSFVYTHDTFVPYPIQMNLYGLPPEIITECICGFAKRKHFLHNPQTFRDWVLKYFGTGLAKHFFFPYNSKLLCTHHADIHPSWTDRFVPKTTMKNLFDGLACQESTNVGYNHHFIYPKQGGIQHFVDNLRKKIKSPIKTNCSASSIDLKNKRVIFENGTSEKYETLITTMPLDTLLQSLEAPTSNHLPDIHKNLRCTSVLNYNIGFTPADFTDKHWIYIPERKYPFYRVGFWSNFSKHMAPTHCSSIYGEFSYLPHQAEQAQFLERMLIDETCEIFGINKNQIVTEKSLFLRHAYVVYDAWRANNLTQLHKTLQNYSIHSIGRYGEWKYSSMQEAILDGKQIVDKLLTRIAPATRVEEVSKKTILSIPREKTRPSVKELKR